MSVDEAPNRKAARFPREESADLLIAPLAGPEIKGEVLLCTSLSAFHNFPRKTCSSIGQCIKEYMQPPVRSAHFGTRTAGAITNVLIFHIRPNFSLNHNPLPTTTTTKHDKTAFSVPLWPPQHHNLAPQQMSRSHHPRPPPT